MSKKAKKMLAMSAMLVVIASTVLSSGVMQMLAFESASVPTNPAEQQLLAQTDTTGTAGEECDGSFSDVACDADYATAIYYLKAQDVINGYPDGTFKPNQVVNRAEILKFTLLSRNVTVPESDSDSGFFDVDATAWYAKYVAKAFDLGWINGNPDGSYKPANTVNRVEILKILAKAFDLQPVPANNLWFDTPLNEWYSDYLQFAKDNNLIDPRAENFYYPAEGMTRGEVAETMYRVIQLVENQQSKSGTKSVKVKAKVINDNQSGKSESKTVNIQVRAKVL